MDIYFSLFVSDQVRCCKIIWMQSSMDDMSTVVHDTKKDPMTRQQSMSCPVRKPLSVNIMFINTVHGASAGGTNCCNDSVWVNVIMSSAVLGDTNACDWQAEVFLCYSFSSKLLFLLRPLKENGFVAWQVCSKGHLLFHWASPANERTNAICRWSSQHKAAMPNWGTQSGQMAFSGIERGAKHCHPAWPLSVPDDSSMSSFGICHNSLHSGDCCLGHVCLCWTHLSQIFNLEFIGKRK